MNGLATIGLAALLGASMTQAANISLNTAEPWLTYGDTQAASSSLASVPGWAYDGNEGSFPWLSDDINPPHWTYTTWLENASIDSVTVKLVKDGAYTTQEFQIQTLNAGGNANNDSDWTTVFTVNDVGTGTGGDPYINDAVFTYTPGSPLLTQGIRTYITDPSQFWQDGEITGGGQRRARVDEIIVEGTIPVPEPTTVTAMMGAGALAMFRRRRQA